MKKYVLLFLLTSLVLTGCGKKISEDIVTGTVVDTDKPEIITSFYPLEFLTKQIVGDNVDVINLAGSSDVHSYEPSPQDMVRLNEADLVVFQGAELEPWTDGVVADLQSKEISILEVTHDLDLVKLEGHDEYEEEHDDHDDKHKEGHEVHENESHDEEHEHHHGEFDPHTWLDPVLAQDMVDEILEAVVAIDVENKTEYETNAQVLKNRFVKLDEDFQTGLAQCTQDELIISHDAYGYLARRYGFEAHTITGISTEDEPSAKILAELKEEASEGITHILIEENNIRRFAETLVSETGLATLSVNPLGRGTLDPQKDFFDVMEENLNSFKTALNCQS